MRTINWLAKMKTNVYIISNKSRPLKRECLCSRLFLVRSS